ncbi:retrotransposon protein, putative, ty1-copia subclass, partial [Tanacetum coccineum]
LLEKELSLVSRQVDEEKEAKELVLQGLRRSKKLKSGALNLYMGNGHHATIVASETFHLCLPSGVVVVLNNCHFAPSITRGIILVSRLYDDGFVNRFENNAISVSKNNLVYFHAILRYGIYEIDLHNSYTNDSSMYVVSNKRSKLNLDSTLSWHCRLGHISKKRIKKLQHDGLLNSTDIESFDKCVSCLSSKMARKPYSHQVERAKDLLGIIHTDDYAPKSAARILNMVSTKKVENTPYEVRHGQAPKMSIRTRHAPNRMRLYIDAEEHELGDLNEPANYKAALLDPESDKWIAVMNVKMQSMKDNQV